MACGVEHQDKLVKGCGEGRRKNGEQAPRPTVATLCGIGRAISFSPPPLQGHFANLRTARAAIRFDSFFPTRISPIEDRSLKDGRQSRADIVERFPPELKFEHSLPRRRPLWLLRRLAASTFSAYEARL